MNDTQILYTFYRLGPDFLTYSYPVEEGLYEEIFEKDRLIGPGAYADYPDAIKAMKENDNFWFQEKGREEILETLKRDLLTLAQKYNKIGAYSLLGSVAKTNIESRKYWKIGADLGNPECMADYAESLYLSGRTTEGFSWLKRSADLGCSLAQMLVGVSYNYGTLSEINLSKAAEYYLMSSDSDNDTVFYKYLNLGVLLIDSGYYHTAMSMFLKMKDVEHSLDNQFMVIGNVKEYLSNIDSLAKLIEFPYNERAKRLVLQEHSRAMNVIFCNIHPAPAPVTPEIADFVPEKWVPTSDQVEIDPRDLEERQQLPAQSKRKVDNHEDYLFLSIPVKITNSLIYGTQHELIFLEKNCHAELNKYIQEHLPSLRSHFKAVGYSFKYLPAHIHDRQDDADLLGSYSNDYDPSRPTVNFYYEEITEQHYWESLVPSQQLPDDCAGILRYVPNIEDKEDNTNYEYILFPYRRGTDWNRAFSELIAYMRTKEFVQVYNNKEPRRLLPSGSYLHITDDYNFIFVDNMGQVLTGVNMPSLSKVLYILLLKHPEGIVLKDMIDYREELLNIYVKIAGNKAKPESIDTMCNPTNNSANEKLSRIKKSFTDSLGSKYKYEIDAFIPHGKRGETIVLGVDRSRVVLPNF